MPDRHDSCHLEAGRLWNSRTAAVEQPALGAKGWRMHGDSHRAYGVSLMSGHTWAGVHCWHKGSMACWCQPASRADVTAEREGGRRHKTVVTC